MLGLLVLLVLGEVTCLYSLQTVSSYTTELASTFSNTEFLSVVVSSTLPKGVKIGSPCQGEQGVCNA